MANVEPEVTPVERHLSDDKLRWTRLLAENLLIRRHVLSNPVVIDARSFRQRFGVVDVSLVRRQLEAEKPRPRQMVDFLVRVHVENRRRLFVFPALPGAIDQPLAVLGNIQDVYRRGQIAAGLVGINQHFIASVQAVAETDGVLILVRQPPSEKVAAVANHGRVEALGLQQFFQAFGDGRAARQRVEHGTRVRILGVDPEARLRALLILQPPVGIVNSDAVDGVNDIVRPRFRRRSRHGGRKRKQE